MGKINSFGTALYGASWKSEMARDLKVNRRTIQRWLDGTTPEPDHVVPALVGLARTRVDRLRQLMRAP